MSLDTVLQLLLWAAVAAGLSFASAVGLARFAGAPAKVMPLQRLRGWDLPVAGFLFFFGQAFGMDWLQRRSVVPGLLEQLLVALAAGVLAWLYLGVREGSLAPRRRPVKGRKVRVFRNVVSCYIVALPGFLAVTWFNNELFLAISGERPVQGVAAGWTDLEPLGLAMVLALAVLVLPLLEEALFRGYLWRFLAGRREFGPRRALAFTALVFALAHEVEAWLPVLYLGGLFGWVYWRSGKLRYAVLVHAMHNALAAATVFLPESVPDALI